MSLDGLIHFLSFSVESKNQKIMVSFFAKKILCLFSWLHERERMSRKNRQHYTTLELFCHIGKYKEYFSIKSAVWPIFASQLQIEKNIDITSFPVDSRPRFSSDVSFIDIVLFQLFTCHKSYSDLFLKIGHCSVVL